jgi:cold-inducible RNA-binding protein
MESKLYVGNLPYSTTETDLRDLFAQAGTVTSVEIVKDRLTGQSKGFAFVQMSTSAEAEKAVTMFNDYSMNNRQLKVNPARPREDRGGFGGPRGGAGGYGRGTGTGHGGGRSDRGDDRRGGNRRY